MTKRPGNARAHVDLADAWAQTSAEFLAGSPQAVEAARQAATEFRNVLILEPRVTHAIFGLGESLVRMGEPDQAEALYADELPKHPEVAAELLVERGTLRARRGDLEDAKADYLRATLLQRQNVQGHYFLAVVYQQMGDFMDAKVEFEKTLAISPKYRDAEQRLRAVQDATPNTQTRGSEK